MTYIQPHFGYDQEPLDSALYSVVWFLFSVFLISGLVYFIILVAFPAVDDESQLQQHVTTSTAVRISLSDLVRVIRDTDGTGNTWQ